MFIDDAKRLLEGNGFKRKSPFELLAIWDGVVADMESGYDFCIYEYDNDVSVRGDIEVIFKGESLAVHGQHEDFRRAVMRLMKGSRVFFETASVETIDLSGGKEKFWGTPEKNPC